MCLRLNRMKRDPAEGPWLLRADDAVELGAAGIAVGQIRFHGGPGVNGLRADDAVELGYSIVPTDRGRGFATGAVRGLMEWA